MKFSSKDFFSKCDQSAEKPGPLQIWRALRLTSLAVNAKKFQDIFYLSDAALAIQEIFFILYSDQARIYK